MLIGVGIYTLDGKTGYEYNPNQLVNSASTIKASYAVFVLEQCEKRGLDPAKTYITYQSRHYHTGSGVIINSGRYGSSYSVEYLISVLLSESDNIAFEMLKDKFTISDFYVYNRSIGGENDGLQWGRGSVIQRRNEWVALYKYITGGRPYSQLLRRSITGTKYSFIADGLADQHSVMYKSGWVFKSSYPAHCDCAIIDEDYLIIVLTQDSTVGSGRKDAIAAVAKAAEAYCKARGGKMF